MDAHHVHTTGGSHTNKKHSKKITPNSENTVFDVHQKRI